MAKFVNSNPASIWASASSRRPDLPELDEGIETEVAIIGGGVTGLVTARHLGKLSIGAVVLEANRVGWGASGRNAGLSRRVVAVATSIVATGPLPADLDGEVPPARRLVSDTKHLMNYFRRFPDNRLIFGGRGSIARTESNSIYAGLEEALEWTFPVPGAQVAGADHVQSHARQAHRDG